MTKRNNLKDSQVYFPTAEDPLAQVHVRQKYDKAVAEGALLLRLMGKYMPTLTSGMVDSVQLGPQVASAGILRNYERCKARYQPTEVDRIIELIGDKKSVSWAWLEGTVFGTLFVERGYPPIVLLSDSPLRQHFLRTITDAEKVKAVAVFKDVLHSMDRRGISIATENDDDGQGPTGMFSSIVFGAIGGVICCLIVKLLGYVFGGM